VGATQVDAEVFFPKTVAPVCGNAALNLLCVRSGTERAVNQTRAYFTSGGGFGNFSAQPYYQRAAVASYLSQSRVPLPPQNMYNANGRGFPDVSAVGHNGLIVLGSNVDLVGGTSQAAPTFGAVLSLLNEEYMKLTGAPLGFVNPLIYEMADVQPNTFQDVVIGDNVCTEGGCAATCKGFYATIGWDPVTGLGTPNYANMLSYIQQFAQKLAAKRKMHGIQRAFVLTA